VLDDMVAQPVGAPRNRPGRLRGTAHDARLHTTAAQRVAQGALDVVEVAEIPHRGETEEARHQKHDSIRSFHDCEVRSADGAS